MAKPVMRYRSRRSDLSEKDSTSSHTPNNDRGLILQSSSKDLKRIDLKNAQNLPVYQDHCCQMQLSSHPDDESKPTSAAQTRIEHLKGAILPTSGDKFVLRTVGVQDSRLGNLSTLADTSVSQQNSPRSLVGTAQDLDQLRSARSKARRSRSRLEKKRKQLGEKRFATEQADEAFMKYTRKIRSLSSPFGSDQVHQELEEHYEALQNTRDEYGPMEEEYTELEDALDEAEYEMAKIENRLYAIMVDLTSELTGPSLNFSRAAEVESSKPGPRPFLGLFAGVQPTFHPLIVKYQTRLGDLDLAKERHDYLVQEREGLLAERETRSLVGFELNKDSKDVLDSLPTREAAILAKIRAIELDVEKLKNDCLQEGLDIEGSDDGSGYSHSVS